jgi:UDP-glucose 4-epimerase
VALRYFNAAGATAKHGEHHEPETHIIPLVLQAAAGQRPHVSVFGDDYETPDRTAIRDYIHVEDLGEAHLLSLRHLRKGGVSQFLNLGNGTGYSVLEVVEAARRVTGRPVPVVMAPRREGDPPRLVGDARRAREILGWQPKRAALEDIVRSAWDWMQAHPQGYARG